ncbi:phospholipase D-like domain-containing protein [Photobacterium damselae]|uniref:phospholipase D-like domain-containing protein n=1 Tax=Photobacterium damselae TaxID=38293 RepID=UPI0030F483A4
MSIDIEYVPKIFSKKVIKQIKNANTRIIICTLYIQNDIFGNRLLNELNNRAIIKPNVSIDIFIDGLSNVNWITKKYKNIKITKIKLNKYLPFKVFHAKGWIIDDLLIYSGVNINNSYFHQVNTFRQDRYFFIKNKKICDIYHNMLLNTTHAFILNNHLSCNIIYQSLIEDDSLDFKVNPFFGFGKENIQSKIFFDLCKSAKKHLFLSTPYFNPDNKTIEIINSLITKKVVIEIVIGINNGNKKNYNERLKCNYLVNNFYLERLVNFMDLFKNEIGKTIFIYHWKDLNNSYHVKNLLVDNRISLLTSSNFNIRSHQLDCENGFIIEAISENARNRLVMEKEFILNNSIKMHSTSYAHSLMSGAYQHLIRFLKKIRLYTKIIKLI